MAYGKIKMGKAKPRPIGLDDLRNRSKKPPKPGTRPEPLTPRGPGKIGKKSEDGDELKRRREYEKAYDKYVKSGGNVRVPKVKNTIQPLSVKKTSPKRPGGR